MPTFGAGVFIGMLAAVCASTVESVGDYHATAITCEVSNPPKHAINRGILAEGCASVASGMVGACHATTSYSGTAGYIAMTGVSVYYAFEASVG